MADPTYTFRLSQHGLDLDPGGHHAHTWATACRVATTGNVTIGTALNAGDTLDGVTLVAGDRVLVKEQTAAEENGIYIVGASPARSDEYAASARIVGSVVVVTEGSTNAGTMWLCVTPAPIVVGTDDIAYALIGSGTVSPGDLAAHLTDTLDAHDASAVSYDNTTSGLTAIDAQGAIDEVAAASGVTLSDATPLVESGSGDAGTDTEASRADHVHPADGGGGGGGLIGCLAQSGALQSLSNTTETLILLGGTDVYDTDGYHFTSAAALTGTVAVNDTDQLAGSGTSFLSELSPGQVISYSISGTTHYAVIKSVESNTAATLVADTYSGAASGLTATRRNEFISIPFGKAGYYEVFGDIGFWTTSGSGNRVAALGIMPIGWNELLTHDLRPLASRGVFPGSTTPVGGTHAFFRTPPFHLDEGDALVLFGWQNSGGALNTGNSADKDLINTFGLRLIAT